MKYKICYFVTFFLIFCSSILFSQIQNFESQTNEIDRLVKEQEKLSKIIEKQLSELQKRSDEISKIKAKKSDNILTNRKLQNLLRDSKEIADELDFLEEKNNQFKKLIQERSSKFIELLDRELVVTFRKTKSFKRNSKKYKSGLKELVNLYHLRAKYIGYIDQSNYSIRLIPIEITLEETQKALRTKLDLLRDQEDYLSSINLIIQEKLTKSEEWNDLTNLAGDLIEDLHVQQTQDEALTKTSTSVSALSTLESGPVKGRDVYTDNSYAFISNELIIPIEFENIYQLDKEQLEEQIKMLKLFQNLVKTKIDSLSNLINKNR